jgi:ribosomal protein L30/L7E
MRTQNNTDTPDIRSISSLLYLKKINKFYFVKNKNGVRVVEEDRRGFGQR